LADLGRRNLFIPLASEANSKCELNGMNPSKEEKGDRDEKKPRLVPDELENVEGDEEEH
jgi:hypothetical protein